MDVDPEIYLRTQVLVVDLLKIITLQGVSKVPSETTVVVSQETTEQGDEGIYSLFCCPFILFYGFLWSAAFCLVLFFMEA